MARFFLSRLAEADLAHIPTTSAQRWGTEGRRRYAAILATAMRKVGADPEGPATRDRTELSPGVRSLHLRRGRGDDRKAKVRRPVPILFFRAAAPEVTEIVRLLHERMEPSRHMDTEAEDG